MGENRFDNFDIDTENEKGLSPIYHGIPTKEEHRREVKEESKEGRYTFTGKNMSKARVNRMAYYALAFGILSIFTILLDNGYLVSLLGLWFSVRAINKDTEKVGICYAAITCSILAILLYIICVAAKPLLQDMLFYQRFMDVIGRYWPL